MSHHYHKHAIALKRELSQTIAKDILRRLHENNPRKHFSVLVRQLLLMVSAGSIALYSSSFWVWFPCSVVLGFIAFDWTVMLHEVIHDAVFRKPRKSANILLGHLYAILGGMSQTQFTHWHLDHHAELGSSEGDPKRAHLTPKIVSRWYKLLYMTPVLFPIYFRASAQATKQYPQERRQKIAKERSFTIFCHFAAMVLLYSTWGISGLLKLHTIPYLFIFPIAFTINRLGQHYNINPEDPANWTTLMKGHVFWDFIYLYSNYHLEHHYFPRVPFYNLPELQKYLQPVYQNHNIRARGYGELLYGWFVRNNVPHTDWLD